ncbi:MAG TPA: hypothetical protein ENN65_00515 [Candidatus Hydrogenedentes bacterium]|nr:hypothetical protein [Candidatus Hydrogenedentota bacterium]
MDDAHLWAAVRCVERNPVRAGLVERAEVYPWSSVAVHCSFREEALLADDFPPQGVIEDWPDWLAQETDIETEDRIRRQAHTGRPCGFTAFMDQWESLLHRTIRPPKRGGKPKSNGKPHEKHAGCELCMSMHYSHPKQRNRLAPPRRRFLQ